MAKMPLNPSLRKKTCQVAEFSAGSDAGVGISTGMVYAKIIAGICPLTSIGAP
jgi:hypothetical protein